MRHSSATYRSDISGYWTWVGFPDHVTTTHPNRADSTAPISHSPLTELNQSKRARHYCSSKLGFDFTWLSSHARLFSNRCVYSYGLPDHCSPANNMIGNDTKNLPCSALHQSIADRQRKKETPASSFSPKSKASASALCTR